MKHNIAKNATNVFVVTKIDSVDTYRYSIKLTMTSYRNEWKVSLLISLFWKNIFEIIMWAVKTKN